MASRLFVSAVRLAGCVGAAGRFSACCRTDEWKKGTANAPSKTVTDSKVVLIGVLLLVLRRRQGENGALRLFTAARGRGILPWFWRARGHESPSCRDPASRPSSGLQAARFSNGKARDSFDTLRTVGEGPRALPRS